MRKLNVIREMRQNWKPARKLRKGDAITGFGVVHAIIPYHTDTDPGGAFIFQGSATYTTRK